jgi:simple sugar transport system ATP-binding protein
MHGIRKAFGACVANDGAALEVAAGEIHALCGENGAGKSTLMKILAGGTAPDAGTVEVLGRDVTGWTTAEAIAAGVGMVHQHFMLVPTLTVAENLVLGAEPSRGVQMDRAAAVAAAAELSRRTGLAVEPERRVSALSVGEAQRVEILKALHRGARVLILDEPTAVLSPPEVAELWDVLRRLRATGTTVVLITHKLDEVLAIADTITIMRAGRFVERRPAAGATPQDIARAMVGRDVRLAERDAGASRRADAAMPPLLTVRDLVVPSGRGPDAVRGVSLDVRPGEILGIAGVEGNGQTELVEAIAGLRVPSAGLVRLGDDEVTRWPVPRRIAAGLAHIPEDRQHRGLVLEWSVADNLVLGLHGRFCRGASLDRAAIAAHADRQVREFDIRPADARLPARALSGGNQQKIVVARELGGGRHVRVLLAAQPTRGVDVGAIEAIHGRLRGARDAGAAILLVSADLGELLALSTRVAVMYGGRIVATLDGDAATPQVLGPLMMGAGAAGSGAAA